MSDGKGAGLDPDLTTRMLASAIKLETAMAEEDGLDMLDVHEAARLLREGAKALMDAKKRPGQKERGNLQAGG